MEQLQKTGFFKMKLIKVGVVVNQCTMGLLSAHIPLSPTFPVTPGLCYLMTHKYQNVLYNTHFASDHLDEVIL